MSQQHNLDNVTMSEEASTLANLSFPGDLMVEILLRLPVNSILRFRAVSKSWYAFLTSRKFIQMHLNQPHQESLLRVSHRGPRDSPTISFFSFDDRSVKFDVLDDEIDEIDVYNRDVDDEYDNPISFSFPFPSSPDDEVRIVGSCNGLLCVHFNRSSSMILWNPAMRKFRFLLLPNCVSFYSDPFFPCIMIGYVPETDDYKVVKVPSGRKEFGWNTYTSPVWVYTLSSDSWEEIGTGYNGLVPKGGSAITINGCLYWISCKVNQRLDVLTSFDLHKQVFGEMTVPYSDITDLIFRKLVLLKGCLSMIIYSESGSHVNNYEVWMMTEQGVPESWTKQFEFSPFSKLARPVGSWRDCELLFGYPDGLSCELLSYDPFTKRTRSFQRRTTVGGFKVVNYVESLESVEVR